MGVSGIGKEDILGQVDLPGGCLLSHMKRPHLHCRSVRQGQSNISGQVAWGLCKVDAQD